jgi:GxxExxY protein
VRRGFQPRRHEGHEAGDDGAGASLESKQTGDEFVGFGETTSPEIERVAHEIVDAAFKIHSKVGPGLLESAYQMLMIYELTKRGLTVEKEVDVPLIYEDVRLDAGYRLDLVVNGCVIVEIKAIERLHPVHEAQVITYLKLLGKRLGILINFNVKLIKDGIKRVVL